MTEPQAWFQCQGLSRSRSLGLAPLSLTAANRVILTSLRGRQAPEEHGLVLQQQLSTWSKLGCWAVPVISILSPVLLGPVPGCWKRVDGDGAVEDQAGMTARLGSQYLLKDILICSDFLQSFALFLKHNYSSSATLWLLFAAVGSICGSSSICGTGQAAHQRCRAAHSILTGVYWYPVSEALLV